MRLDTVWVIDGNGGTSAPVTDVTADRVFFSRQGRLLEIDRRTLERDGRAPCAKCGGYDGHVHTWTSMRRILDAREAAKKPAEPTKPKKRPAKRKAGAK